MCGFRRSRLIVYRKIARFIILVVLTGLVLSCAHVYQVKYLLPDEVTAEVTYQGYGISVELQTRASGYAGSRDMIHLAFVYGCSESAAPEECDDAATVLEFDSVSVSMIMIDTVVYPEVDDEQVLMDDFYRRQNRRFKVSYHPFYMPPANEFVRISYVVRVKSSADGQILASKRFTHDLTRTAYRAA